MSGGRSPIFESVVLAGARTPMAELNTHFKDLTEVELGAIAGREALRRAGADPARVDHVVFGNAMQTSGNAMYGARHVGLKAGLRDRVPALTVTRLCGWGIQSIVTAASLIQLQEADLVLAGGMENMTQAPHVARGLRSGLRMGHAQLEDSLLVGLMDTHCGCSMAQTAETLAIERGITREEADRYALRSQQAAETAYRAGRMKDEIIPVTVRERGKEIVVEEDNHRRPDTTLEGLAKLPSAFQGKGYVTAGNASGIVDGAAAVGVAAPAAAAGLKTEPLGRVITYGVGRGPPRTIGDRAVPG